LADLRKKYLEENSERDGCPASVSKRQEIFLLAYLYKLLMIFELMDSWQIDNAVAHDLRNG